MDANELETKLCAMLDTIASGAKLQAASRAAGMGRKFIFAAIKRSEAGDTDYCVSWRDEQSRRFSELVTLAQRVGRVARDQHLRGIAINGAVQYVRDPWLLARFGDDADAKDMAELAGFPQYPFALDAGGNRIPLLSARYPRPQRQHTPHPHTGPNGTFPKPNSAPRIAVGEQSRGADSVGRQDAARNLEIGKHGLPKYESEWKPDPPPPYARGLKTAAPPPIVHISTPSTPRVMTALEADLRERASRKPINPRPVDNAGRPTMPARIFGQRADDPVENVTGRPTP